MIFKNLENITEKGLNQQKQSPTTTAVLQSCYYNLANLRKAIDHGGIFKNKQNTNKRKASKSNGVSSQHRNMLPELSISNISHTNLLGNSINGQKVHHQGPDITETQSLKDFSYLSKISQNRADKIISQFSTGMKNQLIKKFLKNKNIKTVTNLQDEEQKKKKLNFRTRKTKIMPYMLQKSQKYFEDKDVIISEDVIDKIGIYQAKQIFKSRNVNKFVDQFYAQKMKPIINLRFASLTICSQDQLFLTQNSDRLMFNEIDSCSQFNFLQSKQKEKQFLNRITQNIQERYSKQAILQEFDQILERQQLVDSNKKLQQNQPNEKLKPYYLEFNDFWIIKILNYQITKNQEYHCFKSQNLQDWNQLSFILHRILKYLKQVKISHLSFKFQKQLFLRQMWSCKKIKNRKIEELLKIKLKINNKTKQSVKQEQLKEQSKVKRIFNTREDIVREVVRIWKDRKNLQKMKKQKRKRKQVLTRLCLRMLVNYRIYHNKKRKVQRALELNRKFRAGLWKADVQIYLPSFSEEEFIRSTTQYMETYQNMFYHIWNSPAKQIILILPAVNQILLKMFQQKIKIQKNIILICPDSHEVYPKNLPLAAYLLYSKDSISRIQQILQNKKGIIIPGRRSNQLNKNYDFNKRLEYQINLSDLLMIPLYCNLQQQSLLSEKITGFSQKQLFTRSGIKTPTYHHIKSESNTSELICKLSDLIVQNRNVKKWIFKMNGQFNGRGIAIFQASSSKRLKNIMLCGMNEKHSSNDSKISHRLKKQLKIKIIQYLETYFRLKLKVNFQNCIYRVDEYLSKFLKNGGKIEQYLEQSQTYQFCYKIQPRSNIIMKQQHKNKVNKYSSVCQNYQMDFVTKVSVFMNNQLQNSTKFTEFQQKIYSLLTEIQYIGYVSVIGLYSEFTKQLYAIEIKPFMTMNSSMSQYQNRMIKNTISQEEDSSQILDNSDLTNDNRYSTTTARQMYIRSQLKYKQRKTLKGDNQKQQIENKNIIPKSDVLNNNTICLFIPTIVFTDVDEIIKSEIIQDLMIQSVQQQNYKTEHQIAKNKDIQYSENITHPKFSCLSLGISLSLLLQSNSQDLRKLKKIAIDQVHKLSQKVESHKLYRGKQQIRDVFRFGDVIRAITKIK